jgi:hypothetical protein
VLDCPCGEFLNEVPQPVKAITQAIRAIHSALRDLPPEKSRRKSGIGKTSARSNPDEEALNSLVLEALMLIFVLCGAVPDNMEGANVHPQPLGRPEQVNDNEALNPFSGATETISDPGVPCATVRVPLESVSA